MLRRRWTAFAVAAALLLSVAAPAWAAQTEGVYTYADNETGVTLKQVKNVMGDALTLPGTLGGKPVTALGSRIFGGTGGYYMESVTIPASVTQIDPSFVGTYTRTGGAGLREILVSEGNASFRSEDGVLYSADGTELLYYPCYRTQSTFTVPDGVTKIGDYAFYRASKLQSVRLPAGLREIGACAFGYSGLAALALPEGIETVGDAAFEATALTGLALPASVWHTGKDLLKDCDAVREVSFAGGAVPEGFVRGCDNLAAVTLADGVTAIGDSAFYGCTALTSVQVPGSVRSVGARAFSGCRSLTEVTVGDGVQSLGAEAFAGCTSLRTLTLPDSVETLGAKAFSGSGLTSFTSAAAVWPNALFSGCKSLTHIEVPDVVHTLGTGVFQGCTALMEAILPEGLTEVPDDTFEGCKALVSVQLPASAVRVGKRSFSGCDALPAITLPEGLTSLGDAAFWNCRSLTAVEIPQGVAALPNMAFDFCWSLQSVTLHEGLRTVDSWAFEQCKSLQALDFPASLRTLDRLSMSYMPALRQVTFRGDAPETGGVNPLRATEARQTITVYHRADAAGFAPGSVWETEGVALEILPDGGEAAGPEPIPTAVTFSAVLEHSRQNELILWLTVDVTPKSYENGALSDPTLVPGGAVVTTLNGADLPQPVHFVGGGTPSHSTFGYALTEYPEGTVLTVNVRTTESMGFLGAKGEPVTGRVVWPAWDQQLPFIEGDAGAVEPEAQYTFVPDQTGEGVIVTAVHGELAARNEIVVPEMLGGKPVTGIGERAFANSPNLAYLTLPSTVKTFGAGAFENCAYLISTALPEGVETLPESIYAGCGRLAYPGLPASLREIGANAFADCTRLREVTFPAALTVLDRDAFAGCALTKIIFEGDAPAFAGDAASFGPKTVLQYEAGAAGFDAAPWVNMWDGQPVEPDKPAPEPDAKPDGGTPEPDTKPDDSTPEPDEKPDGGTPAPDVKPDDSTPAPDTEPEDGTPAPDVNPDSGTPEPDTKPEDGTPTPDAKPDSGIPEPDTKPENGAPVPDEKPDGGTPVPDAKPDDSTPEPPQTPETPSGGSSSSSGGSSSGGSPQTEKPSGTQVTVSEQAVAAAVKAADAPDAPIVLRVEGNAATQTAVSVSVPDTLFTALAARETPAMTLATPVAELSFDADSVQALRDAGAKDIVVSAEKLDAGTERPLYELCVTAAGREISQFGGGAVKVALPCDPMTGEDENALVACWVREDGHAEVVRSSAWSGGKLVFATPHFSRYTIEARPAAFADASDAAITFAAARGLMNGVGDSRFDPEAPATGAMALAVLGRMAGVSDADAVRWEPEYLAWAEAQGVLPADFDPAAPLTQDMLGALLAARYGEETASEALAGMAGAITRADLAEAARRTVQAELR